MSRLIDADALKERCKARECDPILKRFTAESWAKAYVAFREEIDMMPTIEAEPVKHGKWVNTYGWVHCSICHQEPPNESNIESDYCPNCGARMDKKV